MKAESLLNRAAIFASAFLVFSLYHQFHSLNHDIGTTSRSVASLPDDLEDQKLRAVVQREMKLIRKLNELSQQISEIKNTTDSLLQQNLRGAPPALPATGEKTPSIENRVFTTTGVKVDYSDDLCHKIRSTDSSLSLLVPYGGECKHQSLLQLEHTPKHLSIATIIPGLAREKDEALLPKVLKSLQGQTVPSDEVVIAMSGVFERLKIRYKQKMHTDFPKHDIRKAEKFCKTKLEELTKVYTKSPIKIICIGERLSSGRARNAAIAASSSDILAFIDSDDTAYPIRNEVIKNLFDDDLPCRKKEGSYPLQLLLHSHQRNRRKPHPYEQARGYTLPNTNNVLPGKSWTGEQCLEDEEGVELRHGRQLLASMAGRPSAWKIADDVANGHPVVRRRALDKAHFSSIPKGQDIILLRDLMYTMSPEEAEQAVYFINRPLTTYYNSGNANADLRNDIKKENKKGGKEKETTKEKAVDNPPDDQTNSVKKKEKATKKDTETAVKKGEKAASKNAVKEAEKAANTDAETAAIKEEDFFAPVVEKKTPSLHDHTERKTNPPGEHHETKIIRHKSKKLTKKEAEARHEKSVAKQKKKK